MKFTGPHGDGSKALYAPMSKPQPQQQQQQQHPFLHAHPSLDFAPAAAAGPHHHHHHGYGTLPPGSLPPLAGLPGMQPAGRGPPTLLDRSHARMIPQVCGTRRRGGGGEEGRRREEEKKGEKVKNKNRVKIRKNRRREKK